MRHGLYSRYVRIAVNAPRRSPRAAMRRLKYLLFSSCRSREIESSEERLPVHYLTGVNDLNGLMDLTGHHSRKERDLRSVKVDEV